MLELNPALERSLSELTTLQATCLADHLAPPSKDPYSFAHHLAINAIDLGASWVASEGGKDVGLALVARRGGFARIDTLGVVPDHRRRGVARTLIDGVVAAARARYDVKLIVEAISQDESTSPLYSAAGFHQWRRLLGWERNAPNVLVREHRTVNELQLRHAAWACARHADKDLPWQLAPETIANLGPPYRSFEHDRAAYCIVRYLEATKTMQVRAIIVRNESRGRGFGAVVLAGAMKALGAERAIVPPLCPEGTWDRFFERCGFTRAKVSLTEWRRTIEKPALT